LREHDGQRAPARGSTGKIGQRCARGEHCPGATAAEDGTVTPDWAQYDSPFCRRDHDHAGRCLASLPEWYVRLRAGLGDKRQLADERVSGSRTAPVPVRLDYDALIRDMLYVLCSWEERVRAAAGLEVPDTGLSRSRRDEKALPAAVAVLTAHFGTLLGLPSEPMPRYRSLRSAAQLPAGTPGIVRPLAGYAEIVLPLSGADAGNEIMHLHYRARSALGETRPPAERLDGVPCKQCDEIGLARASAWSASDAADTDVWSECTSCGHMMSKREYDEWTEMYARYIEEQQAVPTLEAA
jgi:hypothetical protein